MNELRFLKNIQLLTIFLSLLLLLTPNLHGDEPRGIKIVGIQDKSGHRIGLYENSYALIIGVSDYINGWPNLPGVKSDIELVKKTLESHGFNVTMVENPTNVQIKQAFEDFINSHGNSLNTRLLFYFSGHGHTAKLAYGGEMGFIVPSNSPNPNIDFPGFLAKALDMQMVEVYAKRIQSKHALFIFDSCFSGSIFALSRAIPENISYKTAMPVRQFITSGSVNEQVPDKSIFCKQFVEALDGAADADKDGYVTGMELGEFLQKNVVNYSRGTQHPQYGKIRDPNLDKGDFVFQVKQTIPDIIRKLENDATLIIDSIPKGSSAFVDGKMVGITPCEIKLDMGVEGRKTIAVAISKEGYKTERAEISMTAGQKIQWKNIVLEEIPKTSIEIPVKKDDDNSETIIKPTDIKPSKAIKNTAEKILIPAGEFRMGDSYDEGDDDEIPVHKVFLDDFYIDKYEVTNEQYADFLNQYGKDTDNSGHKLIDIEGSNIERKGDIYIAKSGFEKHPVTKVSWYGAAAYAQFYGEKLPTEAQWEKAARGGLEGNRYPWGDGISNDNGNYWEIGGNDFWTKTAPVGSFAPNVFGLYDMAGNVWEWCADEYDPDYYGKSPANNPKGPGVKIDFSNDDFINIKEKRVARGGAWDSNTHFLRLANRLKASPESMYDNVGFRCVILKLE